MTNGRVAAVQATPVFLDREATTDKAAHSSRRRPRTVPSWSSSRRRSSRPTRTGSGARRRGTTRASRLAWSTSPWPSRRQPPNGSVRRLAKLRRTSRSASTRSTAARSTTRCSTSPRTARCRPAPQAHADRRRAHRLGHGRRFHARRRPDPVRRRRRVDLLGELHAARPRGDVRAGRRHLPRTDLGQQRHVGGHVAAHRQGGPAVRHRRRSAAAWQRRAGGPPRRRLRRCRRLDEPGYTTIVAPGGSILAGPLLEEEGILYADIDLAEVRKHRLWFDPVGHYARADVLQLTVDTRPQRAVRFTDG